jgi:hypothetical protein
MNALRSYGYNQGRNQFPESGAQQMDPASGGRIFVSATAWLMTVHHTMAQ